MVEHYMGHRFSVVHFSHYSNFIYCTQTLRMLKTEMVKDPSPAVGPYDANMYPEQRQEQEQGEEHLNGNAWLEARLHSLQNMPM